VGLFGVVSLGKSACKQVSTAPATTAMNLTFVIGAIGEECKAVRTRAASSKVRSIGAVGVARGQCEPARASGGVGLILGQGLGPSGERERNRSQRGGETSENNAIEVSWVLVGDAGELDTKEGVQYQSFGAHQPDSRSERVTDTRDLGVLVAAAHVLDNLVQYLNLGAGLHDIDAIGLVRLANP
jgi:hypothetical protein